MAGKIEKTVINYKIVICKLTNMATILLLHLYQSYSYTKWTTKLYLQKFVSQNPHIKLF